MLTSYIYHIQEHCELEFNVENKIMQGGPLFYFEHYTELFLIKNITYSSDFHF